MGTGGAGSPAAGGERTSRKPRVSAPALDIPPPPAAGSGRHVGGLPSLPVRGTLGLRFGKCVSHLWATLVCGLLGRPGMVSGEPWRARRRHPAASGHVEHIRGGPAVLDMPGQPRGQGGGAAPGEQGCSPPPHPKQASPLHPSGAPPPALLHPLAGSPGDESGSSETLPTPGAPHPLPNNTHPSPTSWASLLGVKPASQWASSPPKLQPQFSSSGLPFFPQPWGLIRPSNSD